MTMTGRIPRRIAFFLVMILSVGLVTACPQPLALTSASSRVSAAWESERVLTGVVDFSGSRQIQADINTEIASASTVGLIQVSTGQAIATTLTNSNGRFSLTLKGFDPSAHIRPGHDEDRLYYVEAIKGLQNGDNNFNAVGGDEARVRTLARWNGARWETLTSLTGSAQISLMTTAVAVVVSLRSNPAFGPALDAAQLIGRVVVGSPQGAYPDSIALPDHYPSAEHPIPLSTFQRAYDLVKDALAKNRDPLRWVALSSADPDHNTVILPDAPFTVSTITPNPAPALSQVSVVGSNFSGVLSDNQVWFLDPLGATISANVATVSSYLSRLTVTVPQTAVTGTLQVVVKGKALPGPIFNLAILSGHSVVDVAGNVYMANKSMNTVSITQRIPGSARLGVKAFVSTGLDSPGALTFGPKGLSELYVACGGSAKRLYKIDATAPAPTPVASSSAASWSSPSGIAYQNTTGDFFVSDAAGNQLYKIPHNGATPAPAPFAVSGVTLSGPRGLCFGPDGKLYLANSGRNEVLVIDVSTGTGQQYLGGLSTPYGLAFDNKGNFYVSNNTGNSVYRKAVLPTAPYPPAPGNPTHYGVLSAFASIPTPGGINADSSGMLFVADTVTNGIYRINQNAETYQVAYGLNYPLSTWVDASGQYILTDSGRILQVDPSGVMTVFAEGLNTAYGLVRDTKGNFYTFQWNISAIVQIRADGSAFPIVTGLTHSAWYASGVEQTSGLTIRNDKLSLRQNYSSAGYPNMGDVLEFTLVADGSGAYSSATGPAIYTAPMDQIGGVAYNPTNSTYYLVQSRTGTLYSLVRSGNVNTYTQLRQDARLTSAQDLWVDPATGRIWVVNDDGGAGNLFVYNANGTDYANYSASVDHPTNLSFDGTRLYVNSNKAAGDVRQLDLSNGTIAKTLSGFNAPHGITFLGTTMYVSEWGASRLSSVANYATAPGAITPAFSTTANPWDLDALNGKLLWCANGSVISVSWDPTSSAWLQDAIAFYPNYYGATRLTKRSDGAVIVVYRYGGEISDTSYSVYYLAWASTLHFDNGQTGYNGLYGDGRGCGMLTPTAMWSYSRGGGNYESFVSETFLDGSVFRTYHFTTNLSGLAFNGTDTVYAGTCQGQVSQMRNGVFTTLSASPYDGNTRSYGGLSYYDGYVYQSIYNKHWIDQINAATGARKTLYQGLVAPEL